MASETEKSFYARILNWSTRTENDIITERQEHPIEDLLEEINVNSIDDDKTLLMDLKHWLRTHGYDTQARMDTPLVELMDRLAGKEEEPVKKVLPYNVSKSLTVLIRAFGEERTIQFILDSETYKAKELLGEETIQYIYDEEVSDSSRRKMELIQCVINGWEPEKSPEEKVKEYYDNIKDRGGLLRGNDQAVAYKEMQIIAQVLNLLEVDIKDINS